VAASKPDTDCLRPECKLYTVNIMEAILLGGPSLGLAEDIAQSVLFAMTSTFLPGQVLHIGVGERLASTGHSRKIT